MKQSVICCIYGIIGVVGIACVPKKKTFIIKQKRHRQERIAAVGPIPFYLKFVYEKYEQHKHSINKNLQKKYIHVMRVAQTMLSL